MTTNPTNSGSESPTELQPNPPADLEAPKSAVGSPSPASKSNDPTFIYVICQNGAEAATKLELMSASLNLNLAFSRPGFITFKVDSRNQLTERFSLPSTLARTYGWSLGKSVGDEATELVEQIAQHPKLAAAKHIHIWQRDPVLPGRNGFEPGVSELAAAIGELFGSTKVVKKNGQWINRVAKPGDLVFDIVMVEPNEWWYGYHFADTIAQRWPGGVPMMDTTIETCSRAYFKLKEALLWSGITIKPGDICAEVGSAPGGASQLLLEMGAQVIGIDPAEMEPEILEHENFTFIRRRSSEVKKRDLRDVKWLIVDVNAAPKFTLDAVTELVQHPSIDVKGIILTIKLLERKLIGEIPKLMAQVKALGFQVVKSRQLAFNRNEFCLVGVKDKFVLRSGKKTKKIGKPGPESKPKSEPESEAKPEWIVESTPESGLEPKPESETKSDS